MFSLWLRLSLLFDPLVTRGESCSNTIHSFSSLFYLFGVHGIVWEQGAYPACASFLTCESGSTAQVTLNALSSCSRSPKCHPAIRVRVRWARVPPVTLSPHSGVSGDSGSCAVALPLYS